MAKNRTPHVEFTPAGDTGIAAPVVDLGPSPRWYQGIDRYAWMVLIICALGWVFDCFDQQLFNLVRNQSVFDLMRPNYPLSVSDAEVKKLVADVGPNLTAVFLLGWAAGGFIFGSLGDKLGRTRTMMITILIYAIFTGLNGLVQTIPQYYVCRFMTALGVGGEFAAGASLVAEVWPQRSRAMGLGLLQALSAVGNIFAALTTLILSAANWRIVFFIGAVPALLVLWVRRSVSRNRGTRPKRTPPRPAKRWAASPPCLAIRFCAATPSPACCWRLPASAEFGAPGFLVLISSSNF